MSEKEPNIKLLSDLLDDTDNKLWQHKTVPEYPKVLDKKYPPTESQFQHLGEEIDGIPTYQIPILLDMILKDPDPAILKAMKDALVLALMTYDHDEINKADEEFDLTKRGIRYSYDRNVKLHNEYMECQNGKVSKVKETFKRILDSVSEYKEDEFTQEKLWIISSLIFVTNPNHTDATPNKEGYAKLIKSFKKLDLYNLLKEDDSILWKIMTDMKLRMKDLELSYNFMDSFYESIIDDIRKFIDDES